MPDVKKYQTLYLCYFGLREPLVQTQVLPYLREIRGLNDIKVALLTFEPDLKNWTKEERETERKKLSGEDIEWHALPYHKWPSVPATFYDVVRGALFIRGMQRRAKIDILHARIHVPMLMAVAAGKLSVKKPKLLFDIRGFFIDEYVDSGSWKKDSQLYRTAKKVEKWLLRKADGFVVLTEKARELLFPESVETGCDKFGRPAEVIPCCVDLKKRFPDVSAETREHVRAELGLENRRVIVHLGALGGVYQTREIVDFLAAAKKRDPRTYAMFLTQTDPALITPLIGEQLADDDFLIRKVRPGEIQRYLEASDLALSFLSVGSSGFSRSPTKIPEYLACGLPVISNKGVGDVDELLINERVGVLLDDFNDESYLKALEEIEILRQDPEHSEICRQTAKKRFDLEKVGGKKYRSIYRKLLKSQ